MESVVQFKVEEKRLYGILHTPENPVAGLPMVLMIVGGPQTRVGSHRSYVQIARGLCASGATVFRFDYRGIGDADGDWVGYNFAETSILSAIKYLENKFPENKQTVLWALCDGAAACLVFGSRLGNNVSGMILCNPYVHNMGNKAESLIRYYYLRRILDKEFWNKLIQFKFNPITFVISFTSLVRSVFNSRIESAAKMSTHDSQEDPTGFDENTLEPRMMGGMLKFQKPILFLLSTVDIVADQFRILINQNKEVQILFKKGILKSKLIEGANHTFSSLEHKNQVVAESFAALKTYL